MHKVKFGISVLTIRFIAIRLLLSDTVVFKNSLEEARSDNGDT